MKEWNEWRNNQRQACMPCQLRGEHMTPGNRPLRHTWAICNMHKIQPH